MNTSNKSKALAWGAFAAFCIIWFYMLGARTLIPTDEGRYAEMAREMAATGDWLTPRLNALKYFEKPPLQLWMTALAFKVFGLGEWQARLWTGLCGLFGILLTAYAGGRVFGKRVGLFAGLVLASSIYWTAMGHINALDMGLACMMTLTLAGLLVAQRSDATARERAGWMAVCWAGMALAVLSKGLVGIVLPGGVLVIYTVVSRDWSIWKRVHLFSGLIIFFAIAAPWFVLVSMKNPEFPQFFFIHEHFQRFTSKIHHREGPWYYFIPILVAGVFPWIGVLVQCLWSARHEAAEGFQPKKMLLVWAAFIFFFFSVSSSKLPSYIVPIFPALALLIAIHLQHLSRISMAITAGVTAIISVVGLALMARLTTLSSDPLDIEFYRHAQPWVLAALAILLAAALVVLWRVKSRKSDFLLISVVVLAAAGFIATQLLMVATEPYGRDRAGVALVPAINAELTADMPIYMVGMYDQTLPYYMQRTVTLVQHADEMEFGIEQEPALWLPTLDLFIERWQKGPKAIAITRTETFSILEKRGVPMRVVASDSRRIVVTNDLRNKP